jgi:SNF family Na+-dependent transporter
MKNRLMPLLLVLVVILVLENIVQSKANRATAIFTQPL